MFYPEPSNVTKIWGNLAQQHTSGPWHINKPYLDCIYSSDGTVIAKLGNANRESNSRLIVAAPRLLVTLEQLTAQIAMQVLSGAHNRNLNSRTLDSTCDLIAEVRGVE